ncbi:MAG: tRNA (adenosine(37)-N6)-threonylcarbamoyltransferase complex transferase subunit TsaD [Thermodesulfobacteriota bacterium]
MNILAIESSCDETAAAVMIDDKRLLANVVDSQIVIHRPFGGVVPELASRHHLRNIYPVVTEACRIAKLELGEIDLLAVTKGPGLIGSLLVGLNFIKSLSMVLNVPFVGVDHMAGHLNSPFLSASKPSFPFIALVASGGHSSLFLVRDHDEVRLLGRTRDDAAGEAFDKVAKLLGLPYPGGPEISREAGEGNPEAIPFPRSWLGPDSVDFSFSGLKTAVANHVNKERQQGRRLAIADICASFQAAVVEVLTEKAILAARQQGISNLVLAGGVAANPSLRQQLALRCQAEGMQLHMPELEFCTDNGAMIALAGYHHFLKEGPSPLEMDVYSRSPLLSQAV